MKKLIVCLVLVLVGCTSSNTLTRTNQSDDIEIAIVIDQNVSYLIDGITIEQTSVYVCQEQCLDKLYELEKEYVDGIILIGEKTINASENYPNINHIPMIYVNEQSKYDALQEIYSDYEWGYINDVNQEIIEKDAYYIEEQIDILIEKPFYQTNNSNSLCILVQDMMQLENDVKRHIYQLIHEQIIEDIVIKWIKE